MMMKDMLFELCSLTAVGGFEKPVRDWIRKEAQPYADEIKEDKMGNLLVYRKGLTGVNLGLRKSLSDVGATVCDFFGVKAPQNGESFLELLK